MLNKFNNCKPISTNATNLCAQKHKRSVPDFDILPTQAKKAATQTYAVQNNLQNQAQLTEMLIKVAQNGNKTAMEKLCAAFEPLFRKEMRRDIFYKSLGFGKGLSLAQLKFIELVMTYNGADCEHFPGYVRCRIHFALYDEVKKVWAAENKKAPLPQTDEAESVLMVTKHHKLALKNLKNKIA